MLGREPRLPHTVVRWLIITLMLVNGVQLVLLQAAINSPGVLGPTPSVATRGSVEPGDLPRSSRQRSSKGPSLR